MYPSAWCLRRPGEANTPSGPVAGGHEQPCGARTLGLCTAAVLSLHQAVFLLRAALNAECSLPSQAMWEGGRVSTKGSRPWSPQCAPAPCLSWQGAAAGTVASQLKTPPCLSSQGKRKGIPCYSLRIESPLKCLWWYLCAEGYVTTWQSGKPEALHQ